MKKKKNKKCSPVLPTNFRVEFNGNDYILLKWDCERDPLLDFLIYMATWDTPSEVEPLRLDGFVRDFTASLLENNTDYYFQLFARDSVGCFKITDVITGRTLEK